MLHHVRILALKLWLNLLCSIVFVDWAKGQITFYAEMFRKQVFSPDVDADTVRECLKTTRALNKKVFPCPVLG